MSPAVLLGIGAVGMALLLFLVLKAKVQPFVALLVVSTGVALAGGVPPAELVDTIEKGMGSTLGHVAIIIALGAMVGRIIELSGGANALAHTLIERFGERRTPLALAVAGFILGIPVFFEVGLIILMPLAYGVTRSARKPLLVYALPMGAAMLTVHAFLPPHPGAVAAAKQIGSDLGWILLLGLPITAVVVGIGYLVSNRLTRKEYPMSPDVRAEVYGSPDLPPHGSGGGSGSVATVQAEAKTERAPSFRMIVALILTPILLILAGTVGQLTLPAGSVLRETLTVVGAPMVALLIALVLSAWLLGIRRGWSHAHVAEVMGSALPPVAMVILVAGAGGVFGKVLVTTGIGDAVADLLQSTGLPLLVLAFAMTLLLRGAQGSATVALVTTAGLITPLMQGLDLSAGRLALVSLAMGAGALGLSHVNDAGYWMFAKLVGLEVGSALRTWTVLTTVMGLTGFALTAAVWPFV
ncbi:GntP family transporter [Saccharopolyspora sp. NPDC050389]|uniref:GntP family transporter n=1 Tax=Saccharopolyspora sp. NPDC050389 TaxID=3155516 RepID=UPI0033D65399